ncbi:hypothetical protein GMA12_13990 [Kocuria sediminis]|uniref:Uncharacterized protein n=1 Tax=Kocuria sediminis TaxID=1038857 RepID=A0A6N8GSG9_9MICC|nr:hypothetical protein [Kocuria sediminis]MUN64233.1 hypothetical protein [Kocuria sediminis]
MSKAVSPQSAARSTDLDPTPLLPLSPEAPAAAGEPPRCHEELLQCVFTAAGEVETAEWALDRALDEAADSDDEIGVGFDVAPVDGTLETARWALDQATSVLHTQIRAASRAGVPVAVLAEASALSAHELAAVLDAAGAATSPAAPPAALPTAG